MACLQAHTGSNTTGVETVRNAAQTICHKIPVLRVSQPPGFSAMYSYVLLYMAMYGHAGLCRVMYGYVGLCMPMYGYLGLFMAM